MSPPDRLTRLLTAARRAAPDSKSLEDLHRAPHGLATRLAARAWSGGETSPVPWLRGLTWGMVASVCLLITAHLTVPQSEPELPDIFGPMLSTVTAKHQPLLLTLR